MPEDLLQPAFLCEHILREDIRDAEPLGGEAEIDIPVDLPVQGDQDSLTTVGRMYSLGEGVKQNADKAREILEKRAEKDDELAEFYLGEMYDKGLGIRKNPDLAKSWYKRAADHGHEEAKLRYAMIVAKE